MPHGQPRNAFHIVFHCFWYDGISPHARSPPTLGRQSEIHSIMKSITLLNVPFTEIWTEYLPFASVLFGESVK